MSDQATRIRELEDEIAKRDNTILMQQNSIDNLKRQIDNLTELILQMRHDKFGPSSEKTVKADDGNQICLFNEVEIEADHTVAEPFKANAKGKISPKKKRVRSDFIIQEVNAMSQLSCTIINLPEVVKTQPTSWKDSVVMLIPMVTPGTIGSPKLPDADAGHTLGESS